MIKAKISEIFRSVQGEGRYTGVKQVFVRFYGCNMHCAWCDTPLAINGTFQEFSLDELFEEVFRQWEGCHSVSLTGGEPLLQTDFLKRFLPLLKKARMPVYLETNGTLVAELEDIIHDIDIIAMDIKMPSSTKEKSYWKEHEAFLKIALKKDVFIKAVVCGDTGHEDIVAAVDLVSGISPEILFILQPNTDELNNGVMDRCLAYQDYCLKHLSNVRIMPQMHKFMEVK